VLDSLELDAPTRERVRSPAGLDLGAVTPGEIAVSIVAEMVATRRARTTGPPAPAPAKAIDPICGMEVAPVDATPHLDVDGERVWFCSEHCRASFAEHAPAG
jgi:xanthine dehydrogenase accessory factor